MPTATTNLSRLYAPLLAQLKAGTTVPIILPVDLSMLLSTVCVSIDQLSSSNYRVLIDASVTCHGATQCRQADVTGLLKNGSTPPLSGTSVTLKDGKTAFFVSASCGASCGDATISWDVQNYRYAFGIKAGTQAELLQAANSATAY